MLLLGDNDQKWHQLSYSGKIYLKKLKQPRKDNTAISYNLKLRLSTKVTFAKGSKMEMTLFFDNQILTGNWKIKCRNKKYHSWFF